jgi:hypothetical protein
MNRTQKSFRTRIIVWAISGVVALMFLSVGFAAIKMLLSDDSQKRRRQLQMVTLVKPPPPPKIKEKPPEHKVDKVEEIIEPQEEAPQPDALDDAPVDDLPPGDELGLDADGSAGADGFGLRANKGGRSLIGGAYGEATLLRKYAWYTRIMQEELRKKVNQHMKNNGGVPDGSLTALIVVTLDDTGHITRLKIGRPSGNDTMDAAVKSSLMLVKISEPPPKGMPRTVELKISSKG